MIERAYELRDEAKSLRDGSELVKAGNAYTAAAYEYAGSVTEHSFPAPDATNGAVSRLRYAATCYRIGGDEFRTQNR